MLCFILLTVLLKNNESKISGEIKKKIRNKNNASVHLKFSKFVKVLFKVFTLNWPPTESKDYNLNQFVTVESELLLNFAVCKIYCFLKSLIVHKLT